MAIFEEKKNNGACKRKNTSGDSFINWPLKLCYTKEKSFLCNFSKEKKYVDGFIKRVTAKVNRNYQFADKNQFYIKKLDNKKDEIFHGELSVFKILEESLYILTKNRCLC